MTDYFSQARRARLPAFALVLAMMAASAMALATPAEPDDPEELDKAWREIALQLPAAPVPGNLLPFYVSPTATQQFAIDSSSISIGKDGVVRYTLVSESMGGARNISFEGLRCELQQKRLYAFGRADGSWSRSRREAWEPVGNGSSNNQHATLANDFLCRGKLVAGTAAQIVERFRKEGRLGDRNTAALLSD